ncbi:MAG: hypothetical protein WKG32_21745 [Gemmatimonadaceae bacterium]
MTNLSRRLAWVIRGGRDAVPLRLVRAAAAILPQEHRVWGDAVASEIAALEPGWERFEFGVTAAAGLVLSAALDALRGRIADAGVLAASLALGLSAAAIDLASNSRLPHVILLLAGCYTLGAAVPRAAWRWGLVAGLCVPLVTALLGFPHPYAYDHGDVWYPLIPSVIIALTGASLGRRVRAQHPPHPPAR